MTADSERSSRRFTRVFLVIVLAGMALSSAASVYVDAFGVFGTGQIPTDIVNDRELKPKLFLAANPAPQAIILGSSAVGKFQPSCLAELSGMPAFNFGMPSGNVEDWYAITRFIHDRGPTPLREVFLGIDADAFDTHSSKQLELSTSLRQYTPDPGLSWTEGTRELFGEESLLHSVFLLWRRFHPASPFDYLAADGFRVEPVRTAAERAGATAYQLHKFTRRAFDHFDQLNPSRVTMFLSVVLAARASGTKLVVFVTPLSPAILDARSRSQLPERMAELDRLLAELERGGLLEYHRAEEVADLARDKDALYDGVHPTATTSNRILLRLFHREHGCGL